MHMKKRERGGRGEKAKETHYLLSANISSQCIGVSNNLPLPEAFHQCLHQTHQEGWEGGNQLSVSADHGP